jgi:hypothetical protein
MRVILHSAKQSGCTTLCKHTHAYALISDTYHLIKKGQTKIVDDCILIQVAVVLSEITWCALKEE